MVKEAINKPWLPLPLGLKPPSTESVLDALSKQGIPAVPPRHHRSHRPHWHANCLPGIPYTEARVWTLHPCAWRWLHPTRKKKSRSFNWSDKGLARVLSLLAVRHRISHVFGLDWSKMFRFFNILNLSIVFFY